MITIGILMMVLVGLWFAAAVIGVVFKIAFTLIGGIFSVIGALIGLVVGGIMLVVLAPLFALALLPAALPILLLAGAIWLIVRATHSTPHAPTQGPVAH
ncbi:MAG TPA: hypothetical protein VIM98_15465 [Dyella sp.]|uniref:hypothetical protein n=1 Tax=Dyella sp. TaxID=1869338 RepID=UPI002F955D0D